MITAEDVLKSALVATQQVLAQIANDPSAPQVGAWAARSHANNAAALQAVAEKARRA